MKKKITSQLKVIFIYFSCTWFEVVMQRVISHQNPLLAHALPAPCKGPLLTVHIYVSRRWSCSPALYINSDNTLTLCSMDMPILVKLVKLLKGVIQEFNWCIVRIDHPYWVGGCQSVDQLSASWSWCKQGGGLSARPLQRNQQGC